MRLLSALAVIVLVSVSVFSQDAKTSTSMNTSTNASASQSGAQVQANGSASADAGVAGSQGKMDKSASKSKAEGNHGASGTAGAKSTPPPKSDIAPGIQIPIALAKEIDSKKAKQGESVQARTTADVVSSGKVVIPRGSKVLGHVTQAKARAKHDSESSLGLLFDSVVLRGGQAVSLQTVIQAVAAPPHMEMPAEDSDMGAENPAPSNGSSGGMGGGGLGATAANTAGAATGAAGGVVGAAGNVAGGVGDAAGNLGQPISGGVHGMIGAGTTGVIGLKDIQLSSTASAASDANGSILTSRGKELKLDSGTQMILLTGASAGPK